MAKTTWSRERNVKTHVLRLSERGVQELPAINGAAAKILHHPKKVINRELLNSAVDKAHSADSAYRRQEKLHSWILIGGSFDRQTQHSKGQPGESTYRVHLDTQERCFVQRYSQSGNFLT